jgi:Zn-dependent protease with chaperone function
MPENIEDDHSTEATPSSIFSPDMGNPLGQRRNLTRFVKATLLFLLLVPSATSLLASGGQTPSSPTTGTASASSRPLLQYSLPPDKLAKAYALYLLDSTLYFATTFWGLLVLWMMLRFHVGPRLRSWAECASRRRILQAAIVMSLFVLVIELTNLPFHIYQHHISLKYGFSVQHWGWWFEDWTKTLLLGIVFASFLGWILYAVIPRSPRRWWFYFWLVLIPVVVFVMFIEPIWIEPMFNRFEPLSDHHPELVAQIERVVHRAGMEIPPARMFEMKASDKTTTLNAYVTGFGATKRVVVWDTTMRQMTTPETLLVFGHEMGHYVLGHIPKEVTIDLFLLLLLLYISHRLANSLLARYGPRWGIRDLSDWASLPLLALLLSLLAFLASPIFNGVSRHFEHQADQYGLEVVHGLIADEPLTAAHAFQKLGELSLDYPYVNKFWEFWAWTHPTIRDRMIFVQTYDPWSEGKQPEFVRGGP